MPRQTSLMTRRTALSGLAAAAVSGCAGGAPSPGRASMTPHAPHLISAGPAFDRTLARGAALGANVAVEDVIMVDTARAPGSVSNTLRAVIGPLRAGDIPAARAGAGPDTLLVSLSNDARAAAPGVVMVGVTARESVGRILEYAGRRGVRRLAVLGGGDPWSLESERAARLFAPRLGLEIADAAQIDPQAPPPGVFDAMAEADAVLIPPGGAALRRLAEPLADAGVQILGTHQWSLGAAPVGGWRSGIDPVHMNDFRRRYAARYGEQPTHLALLAHDAARVVAAALGNDPAAWAPIEAGSGVLEFDESGLAWRGLAVLGVARAGEDLIEGRSQA